MNFMDFWCISLVGLPEDFGSIAKRGGGGGGKGGGFPTLESHIICSSKH